MISISSYWPEMTVQMPPIAFVYLKIYEALLPGRPMRTRSSCESHKVQVQIGSSKRA